MTTRHDRWVAGIWAVVLFLVVALILRSRQGEGEPRVETERYNTAPVSLSPALPEAPVDPQALASWHLIHAVVEVESGGNARMVGADGERGLMQIMPSVWSDTTRHLYGKSQSFDAAFDPRNNLRVGEAHLGVLQQWLYTHRAEWKSDPRHLLLAAWNGGRKRLLKAGFEMKRLPQSVQSYADRVAAIHDARMGEELTAWFNAQLARQGEDDPVLTEIVPKAEEPGGE